MSNTARTSNPDSGATNQSLRAHNLSLALRHILASPGAINRAGIAAQTGISRATMSRLVDELIDSGLVEESEDKLSTGAKGDAPPASSPRPREGLLRWVYRSTSRRLAPTLLT